MTPLPSGNAFVAALSLVLSFGGADFTSPLSEMMSVSWRVVTMVYLESVKEEHDSFWNSVVTWSVEAVMKLSDILLTKQLLRNVRATQLFLNRPCIALRKTTTIHFNLLAVH